MAARQSRLCRRGARRPRPVHLGAKPPRPATRRRCASSSRRPTGWPPTQPRPALRRRAHRAGGAGRGAARSPPRLMPLIRGQISRRRAQGRPFHRRAGGARIRQLAGVRHAGRARHLVSRPFPAHQDPPAGAALRSGRATISSALVDRSASGSKPIARDYAAYYQRCKRANSPAMRDPNAVVYLIPGVGMITFARDKATARIAAEFYVNAINVMRGASGVSAYVGLPEQEAFDIEYWLLEEAKLQRMPKPKVARRPRRAGHRRRGRHRRGDRRAAAGRGRLRRAGRHRRAARSTSASRRVVQAQFGRDAVVGVSVDVTDEAASSPASREATLRASAASTSSSPTPASPRPRRSRTPVWRCGSRNIDVLATGYFLVGARGVPAAASARKCGGAIVFIASKNALAASPGAAAYCAAKASEMHLARCLALEGAPHGHPRQHGQSRRRVARLENLGRANGASSAPPPTRSARTSSRRSIASARLLKRSVLPEDIAEGVYFFASDLLRQIHRQYPQRRRRQRRGLHRAEARTCRTS